MEKIRRKTLLYKGSHYGTDYCLNHVEGCAHGCKYPCYAFLIKQKCQAVKNYGDWIKPKLVENALELLEAETTKLTGKIGRVYMCFATDPFMQGQDEVVDTSLRIIDKLNKKGIPCSTLTKGICPDELGSKIGAGKENRYGITVVSLNKEFKRKFEPYTPIVEERIKALKKLHEKGYKTWVSLEPYPPPSLVKQNVLDILDAISFVNELHVGKLNYNKFVFTDNKDIKEFYNETFLNIINFCKAKNIDCDLPQYDEERIEEDINPSQLVLDLKLQ